MRKNVEIKSYMLLPQITRWKKYNNNPNIQTKYKTGTQTLGMMRKVRPLPYKGLGGGLLGFPTRRPTTSRAGLAWRGLEKAMKG